MAETNVQTAYPLHQQQHTPRSAHQAHRQQKLLASSKLQSYKSVHAGKLLCFKMIYLCFNYHPNYLVSVPAMLFRHCNLVCLKSLHPTFVFSSPERLQDHWSSGFFFLSIFPFLFFLFKLPERVGSQIVQHRQCSLNI